MAKLGIKIKNWNLVNVSLGPDEYKIFVNLKKLKENFVFFQRQSNLTYLKKNKKCIRFPFISKDVFKSLLKIISKGKFSHIISVKF